MKKNYVNVEKIVKLWEGVVRTLKSQKSENFIFKLINFYRLFTELQAEILKDARYFIITYPKCFKDIIEFSCEKLNEIIDFIVTRISNDEAMSNDVRSRVGKYKYLIDNLDQNDPEHYLRSFAETKNEEEEEEEG